MKIIGLFLATAYLSHSPAMAESFGTADRASYIITLDRGLDEQALNDCMEEICELSGNREVTECEIVSKIARIAAASLRNAAAQKVGALSCVRSVRAERFDFEPRPRR